eukprot:scaffold2315_cov145-Isochrysis_galbana.AAC.13
MAHNANGWSGLDAAYALWCCLLFACLQLAGACPEAQRIGGYRGKLKSGGYYRFGVAQYSV